MELRDEESQEEAEMTRHGVREGPIIAAACVIALEPRIVARWQSLRCAMQPLLESSEKRKKLVQLCVPCYEAPGCYLIVESSGASINRPKTLGKGPCIHVALSTFENDFCVSFLQVKPPSRSLEPLISWPPISC